ncbi:MAG: hypothetical protein GY772_29715, partial [bacterium]|nr:hypothetical protein [bacterium]
MSKTKVKKAAIAAVFEEKPAAEITVFLESSLQHTKWHHPQHLRRPIWQFLAAHVKPHGLKEFLQEHPDKFEVKQCEGIKWKFRIRSAGSQGVIAGEPSQPAAEPALAPPPSPRPLLPHPPPPAPQPQQTQQPPPTREVQQPAPQPQRTWQQPPSPTEDVSEC